MSELSSYKKILFMRLDRIGDLILSTPLLKILKENNIDSKLFALVKPYTKEILEGNPYVDEVLTLPEGKSGQKILLDRLRQEKFDLVIGCSPTMETYILAWKTGAKERIGYTYSGRILPEILTKIFLTKVKVFDLEGAIKKGKSIPHEVEQVLEIGKMLKFKVESNDLEFPVSEEDVKWAEELIKEKDFNRASAIVGIHLSIKWLETMREDELIRLLVEIMEHFPELPLVITYSRQEEFLAARLGSYLQDEDKARRVLIAGDFDIKKWAALLSKCSVVITTDTGATHVAASQKVPVICLYSKKTFHLCSRQWHPWKVEHRNLVLGEPVDTIPEIISSIREILKEKLSI